MFVFTAVRLIGSNMRLTVEFTGLAKQIVGHREIELDVPAGTTYAGVVERFGAAYPGLISTLIDTDGKTFLSSNMFIINGDMALPAMVMNETPNEGDRLVLVSVITGG